MTTQLTIEVNDWPYVTCVLCQLTEPCTPLKICRTDETGNENYISPDLPLRVIAWVEPHGWRQVPRHFDRLTNFYCPACAPKIESAIIEAIDRTRKGVAA